MPSVVGVVFQNGGKIYHFDPGALELERGDHVVVQTMRGTEIGSVVESPHEIGEDQLPAPLKRVVRLATPKDKETVAANETLRQEALSTCRKLVAQHGLEMKVVDAEIVFGGGKVTFSFYSEERVDFRALVVDLARALKMRIELRQIGVRDEARILGGLGPVWPAFLLHTLSGGSGAGIHPHGQRAESPAQSHEDIRALRSPDVLSQVRAGAVRRFQQGGATPRHPCADAQRPRHGYRLPSSQGLLDGASGRRIRHGRSYRQLRPPR